MSLTYSYLGNKNGQFFISGAGSIYQYSNQVPFSGETLPEIVVPPEYAAIVGRLFATDTIQLGLSERQQIVMADGPTLIATRTANEQYPSTMYDRVEAEGSLLFIAPDKKKLLETFI